MIVLACLCQGCYDTPQQVTLPPTKLSAVDLQFGRQQVDQMMRDRSEMISCVQKDDIIYEWATRQFAGEATGERIYWSADPPTCPVECLSSHNPAHEILGPGLIKIRERHESGPEKGRKIGCEELWSCVVFELYNISYGKEHNAVYNAAISGQTGKQQYIIGVAKIEFKAIKETAQFHDEVWRPWSKTKGKSTEPSYWFTNEPDTYSEWIKQYNDPSGYPYSYYGHEYDSEIAPHIKR
jgi:hypothetical protein